MKIHKLTVVLLVLVFGTLGLTVVAQTQTQRSQESDSEALKRYQEKKKKFPTAEYEEAELTDPKKNQARKEKNLRHNNFSIVAKNPPEWWAETMFIDHDLALTPALPIAQSGYILVGEVKTAEAHVSENKKNVYSEFTVVVSEVLKTANSSIIQGTEITVDRIGGFVKYPNGHTKLYTVSGKNMPTVGERYLFFLKSPNNQDLIIVVTAYQLSSSGIVPLDDSNHFKEFRGTSEKEFLQNLRDVLSRPSVQ